MAKYTIENNDAYRMRKSFRALLPKLRANDKVLFKDCYISASRNIVPRPTHLQGILHQSDMVEFDYRLRSECYNVVLTLTPKKDHLVREVLRVDTYKIKGIYIVDAHTLSTDLFKMRWLRYNGSIWDKLDAVVCLKNNKLYIAETSKLLDAENTSEVVAVITQTGKWKTQQEYIISRVTASIHSEGMMQDPSSSTKAVYTVTCRKLSELFNYYNIVTKTFKCHEVNRKFISIGNGQPLLAANEERVMAEIFNA